MVFKRSSSETSLSNAIFAIILIYDIKLIHMMVPMRLAFRRLQETVSGCFQASQNARFFTAWNSMMNTMNAFLTCSHESIMTHHVKVMEARLALARFQCRGFTDHCRRRWATPSYILETCITLRPGGCPILICPHCSHGCFSKSHHPCSRCSRFGCASVSG